MVLTVSFVLSPGIGLSCPRRLWLIIRRLGASVEASGPHDFAVRRIVTRQLMTRASTASRLHVRDDRETPLGVGRDTNRNKAESTRRSSNNSENQKYGVTRENRSGSISPALGVAIAYGGASDPSPASASECGEGKPKRSGGQGGGD